MMGQARMGESSLGVNSLGMGNIMMNSNLTSPGGRPNNGTGSNY